MCSSKLPFFWFHPSFYLCFACQGSCPPAQAPSLCLSSFLPHSSMLHSPQWLVGEPPRVIRPAAHTYHWVSFKTSQMLRMLLQSLTWYAIHLFTRIPYYIMLVYDLGFLFDQFVKGREGLFVIRRICSFLHQSTLVTNTFFASNTVPNDNACSGSSICYRWYNCPWQLLLL